MMMMMLARIRPRDMATTARSIGARPLMVTVVVPVAVPVAVRSPVAILVSRAPMVLHGAVFFLGHEGSAFRVPKRLSKTEPVAPFIRVPLSVCPMAVKVVNGACPNGRDAPRMNSPARAYVHKPVPRGS